MHRLIPGRDGGTYVLGNVIGLCDDCHYRIEGLSPDEIYNITPYGLDVGKVLSKKWFESHNIII